MNHANTTEYFTAITTAVDKLTSDLQVSKEIGITELGQSLLIAAGTLGRLIPRAVGRDHYTRLMMTILVPPENTAPVRLETRFGGRTWLPPRASVPQIRLDDHIKRSQIPSLFWQGGLMSEMTAEMLSSAYSSAASDRASCLGEMLRAVIDLVILHDTVLRPAADLWRSVLLDGDGQYREVYLHDKVVSYVLDAMAEPLNKFVRAFSQFNSLRGEPLVDLDVLREEYEADGCVGAYCADCKDDHDRPNLLKSCVCDHCEALEPAAKAKGMSSLAPIELTELTIPFTLTMRGTLYFDKGHVPCGQLRCVCSLYTRIEEAITDVDAASLPPAERVKRYGFDATVRRVVAALYSEIEQYVNTSAAVSEMLQSWWSQTATDPRTLCEYVPRGGDAPSVESSWVSCARVRFAHNIYSGHWFEGDVLSLLLVEFYCAFYSDAFEDATRADKAAFLASPCGCKAVSEYAAELSDSADRPARLVGSKILARLEPAQLLAAVTKYAGPVRSGLDQSIVNYIRGIYEMLRP